jgi:hypothetical protein
MMVEVSTPRCMTTSAQPLGRKRARIAEKSPTLRERRSP